MKNKIVGFVIGVLVALSIAAVGNNWTKHDLKKLIREVVEDCRVDPDHNNEIICR